MPLRRRTLQSLLAALLVLGCSGRSTGPQDQEAIHSGTITSRSPMPVGVRDAAGGVRTELIPRMLVEENPGQRDRCSGSVWYMLSESTRVVRHDGSLADTSALRPGQRVRVTGAGVVMESCPPITSAALVELAPPSPL